jgi:hypothetical protein
MAAIGANSKQYSSIQNIAIGTSAMRNFYDMDADAIQVPSAPNFGRIGFVQEIRDKFLEDMTSSEAVFALPRSGLNTIRPEWLAWPHTATPETAPTLDTPEAFRKFLLEAEPTSAGTFEAYRNVPSSSAPNISVFMLGPTDKDDFIRVQAVYDIDYVTTNNPAGVYCSVRRYKNGARTHYYDIFYEIGEGDAFSPTLVAFERKARLATKEGDAIDRFKVSHGGPFYFLWLPDPSINPFKAEKVVAPSDPKDPRSVYGHLAGKTGFMIALPMFPSF